MRTMSRVVPALALALSLAPPAAGQAPSPGDCAVLDQLLAEARTEFPALKDRNPSGARCLYRTHEFKCVFAVGTDLYDQAQAQRQRLERCTAAQPDAELLTRKRSETLFQVNPETRMAIRGPDPEDGHWTVQFRITTSAEWE